MDILSAGRFVGTLQRAAISCLAASVPEGPRADSWRRRSNRRVPWSRGFQFVVALAPILGGSGAELSLQVESRWPEPDALLVYAGDTVTWWWGGLDGNHAVRSLAGDWESGIIVKDAVGPAYSHQFTEPGSTVYLVRTYSRTTNSLISERAALVTTVPAGGELPVVALNYPPDGAPFAEREPILLLASLYRQAEMVRRVEFQTGDRHLGTADAPPYQMLWTNAPAGTNAVVARAYGNQGEIGASTAVSVIVVPGLSAFLSTPRPLSNGAFAFHYTVPRQRQFIWVTSNPAGIWEGVDLVYDAGIYIEYQRTNTPNLFYKMFWPGSFAAQATEGPGGGQRPINPVSAWSGTAVSPTPCE